MKNLEIAKIFSEFADILEMQGVEWKPIAYRRAARGIDAFGKPIEVLYKEGGLKALETIPGVGKHLSLKIEEFLKTGKIKAYIALKKEVPSGLEEMMHIPGLGPKKINVLYKKLKVTTVKQLTQAARAGKVAKLPGFGKKSEQEILSGYELVKGGKEAIVDLIKNRLQGAEIRTIFTNKELLGKTVIESVFCGSFEAEDDY